MISVWRPQHDVYYGRSTICMTADVHIVRTDASAEHVQKCQNKLNVLLEQQVDLGTAIDQLLDDIQAGRKYMKVYRQMKMYNDPATNPVLYKK